MNPADWVTLFQLQKVFFWKTVLSSQLSVPTTKSWLFIHVDPLSNLPHVLKFIDREYHLVPKPIFCFWWWALPHFLCSRSWEEADLCTAPPSMRLCIAQKRLSLHSVIPLTLLPFLVLLSFMSPLQMLYPEKERLKWVSQVGYLSQVDAVLLCTQYSLNTVYLLFKCWTLSGPLPRPLLSPLWWVYLLGD